MVRVWKVLPFEERGRGYEPRDKDSLQKLERARAWTVPWEPSEPAWVTPGLEPSQTNF